jgi:CelD/BcsL family acetyltransferase involved in cellulose biosynthesis
MMDYSVREETFDSLFSYWRQKDNSFHWNCFFVLPPWLQTWWNIFGKEKKPCLQSFWADDTPLGIAPLMLENNKALFMGSPDVCDYQDFIVAHDLEEPFFNAFLDELLKQGIRELDLHTVRPDSQALLHLVRIAKDRGYTIERSPAGFSMEMHLPRTWEDYLKLLTSKQRHETRRKLRRLEESAHFDYRVLQKPEAVNQEIETFFELFRMSRSDKTEFLGHEMESFFRLLIQTFSATGLLKLCFLDIDHQPASAVLCFDYNRTIYLYNNGFNPEFSRLSAGLLSKVLNIKHSIESGREKYNFLKGNESYKRHLGGIEVPLFRCQMFLSH